MRAGLRLRDLIVALTTANAAMGCVQTMPATPAANARSTRPALHIAQLGFGANVHFAACAEPACPRVTRKTLAIAPRTVESGAPLAGSDLMPASLPTPRSPSGSTLTLHFAPTLATLNRETRRQLALSLGLARQAARIVIAGRTDDTGSTRVNASLALSRSLAVRDYLRRALPDVDNRIVIDARGRCCYVADNQSGQGRQANRRVDVTFQFSATERPTS